MAMRGPFGAISTYIRIAPESILNERQITPWLNQGPESHTPPYILLFVTYLWGSDDQAITNILPQVKSEGLISGEAGRESWFSFLFLLLDYRIMRTGNPNEKTLDLNYHSLHAKFCCSWGGNQTTVRELLPFWLSTAADICPLEKRKQTRSRIAACAVRLMCL